jgi:hypothetical protein
MIHSHTFWLVSVALIELSVSGHMQIQQQRKLFIHLAPITRYWQPPKDSRQISNRYWFQAQVLMPHIDYSKLIA